jgi:hypothetical protein
MACRTIVVNGVGAIVCGPRPRSKKCCACAKPGELLCDWKIGGGKTCDKPICAEHAQHVDDDKDLCPEHQEAYRNWLERHEWRA